MTIEDDIAFLARVPTFAKFGFAALQIVAIGSESRHLADGETLFRAGDATDAGFVIQSGSLLLTTDDPRSDQTIRFGPGTLIGELALLTETVTSATAVAAEPTTVIRISRNLFRKVLEGFPEPARVMRDRLAARADHTNGELARIRALLTRSSKETAGNAAKNGTAADSPSAESGQPPPGRARR